jgi:hypothetical protein
MPSLDGPSLSVQVKLDISYIHIGTLSQKKNLRANLISTSI